MDKREVYQAVSHWLASEGCVCSRATTRADSLRTWGGNSEWFVVLRGDCDVAFDYQRCFDAAMGAVITKNREQTNLPLKLGIAVSFSSTLRGDPFSYRKALKKFSNSIVFTDLDVSLLLVEDDLSVKQIESDNVNNFLQELNRYILAQA